MSVSLNAETFRQHTTQQHVRVLQIVFGALAMGVVSFTIIILAGALIAQPGELQEEHIALVRWLTIATLAVTLLGFVLWINLPRWLLSEQRIRQSVDSLGESATIEAMTEMFHAHLRSTEIIRLAALEASAIFGLVVCVLALVYGALPTLGIYWANLIPSVLFLAVIGSTFPTADRMAYLFQAWITPSL